MEELTTPVTGKADWRHYRSLRLENGVTCLLINDSHSKTLGMSTVVDVGAAADPRSLSGLAHFCEHMCFLGSEKYPGENEYKRYLSSHGGRSNASTSMHLTNYKFEVLADHAEKAVDLFSNFFVAPLFTSSGTGREVQAVDSENSKNLTADVRRRLQILKDIADPEHYYSKFSTGNSQTLPTHDDEKIDWIREALLTFHRKHYTPENMTVVVAGPQSLDTLQEWIVPRYSAIKKKDFPEKEETMSEMEKLISHAAADAPAYTYNDPAPPFSSAFKPELQGSWPILMTTKPLRSMRKLVMMFPMQSDRKIPDQSPSSMLSHLLGHEGPGSAFAVLQNHGMLSSLSAGARTSAPDFNLFQIDMGLTEKGEAHWREVVDIVFAYCQLITETSVQVQNGKSNELPRIWGEMSELDTMFFNQTSPGGAYDYAPNLAERVIAYGPETCLSAGSMLNESKDSFPSVEVIETSRYLVPSNCIIERCSETAWNEAEKIEHEPGFGKRKEKWYGVEYYLSNIDQKNIKAWEGQKTGLEDPMDRSLLHLPRPNRYIPRTLDLSPDLLSEAKLGPRIEKKIDPPELLIDDAKSGRLFHRLDDRYALPQSSISFLIRNAAVQNSKSSGSWEYDANTGILSSILSGAFNEAMAQETYDAELAGLYWSLSLGSSGVKLSCFGFSDRLPDLALKVLGDFLSGDFLEKAYFDSTNDRMIRGLRTYFESRRADSHAMYYRDALVSSVDDGIPESLAMAEAATLEATQEQHARLIQNDEVKIDCLFSGNVSKQEATDFYFKANSLIEKSHCTPEPGTSYASKNWVPAGLLERRLPQGEDIELHFPSKNPEEENGAVIFTYQSAIPAYKGEGISHPESLESTSAIRLLCQMLREPLFDDLRTKQQLGYIVGSYYELGISSRTESKSPLGPLAVSVDSVTINVLSKKVSPSDVAGRIDEFLISFRESLQRMPESEIQDHADALSTKLLKPIQKLNVETSGQFGKIQRYAPEIFFKEDGQDKDLPWDSVEPLARTIKSLKRSDLVQVWDRLMQPGKRCRIVSCVYGNTFPLKEKPTIGSSTWGLFAKQTKIVNNFQDVIRLRKRLEVFDDSPSRKRGLVPRLWNPFVAASGSRNMLIFGIGVFGFGVLGLTMTTRNKKMGLKR